MHVYYAYYAFITAAKVRLPYICKCWLCGYLISDITAILQSLSTQHFSNFYAVLSNPVA